MDFTLGQFFCSLVPNSKFPTNNLKVRVLYKNYDNVNMCIKCELLDTISKETKQQNEESTTSMKTLFDRPKSDWPQNIWKQPRK